MFMLPRRGKAFSPDVVSTELPESATKTDKSLGSFDYAPLSFETNMVVEALRSGRAERYGIDRRTEKYGIAKTYPSISSSKGHSLFPISSPSIESR